MITEQIEYIFDFGLQILFDGKKYKMFMPYCKKEYPIGGLISEYIRLEPSCLKEIIMGCKGLDKPGTYENFNIALNELKEKLTECQLPVIATMIILEFFNTSKIWFNAVRDEKLDELYYHFENDSMIESKIYVFDNTSYSDVGGETVLQLLLTCYLEFIKDFEVTKTLFIQNIEDNVIDSKDIANNDSFLFALYRASIDSQSIDFRIIDIMGKLDSMFTIRTSLSLLLFEMAQCINTRTNIVQCKNCGYYFVPEGRSDTVYCSYPLEGNKEKTCKDVGAQMTRANKEKTDIITREYRKLYMRYKMAINRHPEDKELENKFNLLNEGIKVRRKEMAEGNSTAEEIIKWLSTEF